MAKMILSYFLDAQCENTKKIDAGPLKSKETFSNGEK